MKCAIKLTALALVGAATSTTAVETSKHACLDLSSPFHADKNTGQMGINIKPTADLSSVLAPRWSSVCSKVAPGECSWFHTGEDESAWFMPEISSIAYPADQSAGTAGSFSWPTHQNFAYYVCRDAASTDCKSDKDLKLAKMCASYSSNGDSTLLTEEFEHRYSYAAGSGWWYDLYRGRIIESTCLDFSKKLHADKSTGQLSINVKPTAELSSVLAPRWNDVCSKLEYGECSWFHTGEERSGWFNPVEAGESYAYAADWAGTDGSFVWPDTQHFAYHICRSTGSSSDCRADGDLVLKNICSSYSKDDTTLLKIRFEHRFSYQGGTGRWDMLYQGIISGATRKVKVQLKGNNILSLGEVQVFDVHGVNRALHKPAIHSSMYSYSGNSFPASNAVNGNFGDFTHTQGEQGAWWEVDLEENVAVREVIVWNRPDGCCKERLSNSVVSLLDASGIATKTYYIGDASNTLKFTYSGIDSAGFKLAAVNTHLFIDSSADFFNNFDPDSENVFKDDERQEAIFNYVGQEYDMVGFTEVWADSRRDAWKSRLTSIGYTDPVVADANKFIAGTAGSSGMIFADRGETHQTCFMHYQDMEGADALAYKGVVYGASTIRGTTFGWLLTHAQASYTDTKDRDDAARIKQIKETLIPSAKKLVQWMKDNKDPLQGPVVLLGDLNIIGDTTTEYNNFKADMAALDFEDCWLNSKAASDQDGYTYDYRRNGLVNYFDDTQKTPQRLDYIFFHPGESGGTCEQFRVRDDWKTDDDWNVSDHDPVEVLITGTLEGAKVKSSPSVMPCQESCLNDSQCATGNCFSILGVDGECQCNTGNNKGCASGETCWDLSNYEPNECIGDNEKRANGECCGKDGHCKSNVCKYSIAGCDTCEAECPWWDPTCW